MRGRFVEVLFFDFFFIATLIPLPVCMSVYGRLDPIKAPFVLATATDRLCVAQATIFNVTAVRDTAWPDYDSLDLCREGWGVVRRAKRRGEGACGSVALLECMPRPT